MSCYDKFNNGNKRKKNNFEHIRFFHGNHFTCCSVGPTHPLSIHSDFTSGIGVLCCHDLECELIGPVGWRSELVCVLIVTISNVAHYDVKRNDLPRTNICFRTQIHHKVHIMTCYRSGTLNSNTVNSKFHLIRSFFEIFARFLSFHV